jgi:hypothetical protein
VRGVASHYRQYGTLQVGRIASYLYAEAQVYLDRKYQLAHQIIQNAQRKLDECMSLRKNISANAAASTTALVDSPTASTIRRATSSWLGVRASASERRRQRPDGYR